jgi:hypothetical protein
MGEFVMADKSNLKSYHARYIADYVEQLDHELTKAQKDLEAEKQKALTLGGISCQVQDVTVLKLGFNRYQHRTPDAGKIWLEQQYDACKKIHIKNAPSIENNKKVLETLTDLLIKVGLKVKDTYRKTKRSRFDSYREAAWLVSLKSQLKVDDGYETVERDYRNAQYDIRNWVDQYAREQEAAKKAEADKLAATKQMVQLNKFRTKFNLPGAQAGDIFKLILEKNKYLRLGHYLKLNRSDSSGSTQYAREGLSRFGADTTEDKKIINEITQVIQEFTYRPRPELFRDCEYNYDFLLEKAEKIDKELVDDYTEFCCLFHL